MGTCPHLIHLQKCSISGIGLLANGISSVGARPKVRAYSFKGSLKVVTHSAMKATQATIMIQPAVVI